MRSLRRFAPQDDMIFEDNKKFIPRPTGEGVRRTGEGATSDLDEITLTLKIYLSATPQADFNPSPRGRGKLI